MAVPPGRTSFGVVDLVAQPREEKGEQTVQTLREGKSMIKMWADGVPVEPAAIEQLKKTASLPFVHRWVAAMPDVHVGIGATVGSVVATDKAIVPAAVGVDIGCGMMAFQTNVVANDLPDSVDGLRTMIEATIPVGRTDHGGENDRGAWKTRPTFVDSAWAKLLPEWTAIVEKHPVLARGASSSQLGTLGSGNHFIEVCLDGEDRVWLMLHSGSRGPGNRVGSYFIETAKREMERYYITLPDKDLSYLVEGTQIFDDYVKGVHWAQEYARTNRELMMGLVLEALRSLIPSAEVEGMTVNCHHNYVARENHFGRNVWVTRKGAVRARVGDFGIIPGSMGARSYIVKGLGNADSFMSCSHGAGRTMSRNRARGTFTIDDHAAAVAGISCRVDADVIDETPMAYKDIDAVMAAQTDLVEPVVQLRQILCVKG